MLKNITKKVTVVTASILGILLMSAIANAQTVRPLINELNNPAKGHVEYVNDSLTPLNVVLEVKSFTVSETGELSYRPLDPNIHVKLSATSFRVQPEQTYHVYYEANSTQSPAWFVIYAAFSGFPFRTAQGMNVRLELPHTVYLLPKQSVQKEEIHITRAEMNSAGDKVLLEVENTGNNFGRIMQTYLVYSKKKQEAPGFPVFPHSKRSLEIPFETKAEGENVPLGVLLEFQNFKIEQKLQAASAMVSASAKPEPAAVTEDHSGEH
jgi:hypothetical protein